MKIYNKNLMRTNYENLSCNICDDSDCDLYPLEVPDFIININNYKPDPNTYQDNCLIYDNINNIYYCNFCFTHNRKKNKPNIFLTNKNIF